MVFRGVHMLGGVWAVGTGASRNRPAGREARTRHRTSLDEGWAGNLQRHVSKDTSSKPLDGGQRCLRRSKFNSRCPAPTSFLLSCHSTSTEAAVGGGAEAFRTTESPDDAVLRQDVAQQLLFSPFSDQIRIDNVR